MAMPPLVSSSPTGSLRLSRTRAVGFAVMTLSTVAFSAMSVLVRLASGVPGVTTYHSTLFRFGVGIVLAGLYLPLFRRDLRVVNWPWLIVRGVFGGAAVVIYFRALVEIGLVKGTILIYTYPVFAGMFAPALVGERVGMGVWVAVVAAFAGLYLLIVPESGLSAVTAMDLLALFGGLLSGVAVLAIKRCRETESSFSIFLSQCAFGLAAVAIPAARASFAFPLAGWTFLVGIGLAATVAQLTMTYAYKHVGGTEGSLLGMLTPVWNALMGVVWFHEAPSARMLVGGAIVLVACGYAAVPGRRPPPQGP